MESYESGSFIEYRLLWSASTNIAININKTNNTIVRNNDKSYYTINMGLLCFYALGNSNLKCAQRSMRSFTLDEHENAINIQANLLILL